jgi:hypothetical protein
MRALRAFLLFAVSIALLGLAGYVLPPTDLALPVALAGVSCVALALA